MYKKMDSATVVLKHIESEKIMKLNFWEANMQDMTQTKIVCKIYCNKAMYSHTACTYFVLVRKFSNLYVLQI